MSRALFSQLYLQKRGTGYNSGCLRRTLCRGKLIIRKDNNTIMGDKSPKSVHKQVAQKQIKNDAEKQRKQRQTAQAASSKDKKG